MKEKKSVFDMGPKTSEAFQGNSESKAIKELYGESAELFASIIKSRLPSIEQKYTLVDIGSFKGELPSNILKLLPEYDFDVTITDTNSEAIENSIIKGNKIVADAESLPFGDRSIDVVMMRYVLQFNSLESQRRILSEVSRITKGFAIIQHAGADNNNPESWRQKVDKVFIDERLSEIKRSGILFLSGNEVESVMNDSGIKFEKLSSKRINGLSEIFFERYALTKEQLGILKEILREKDYIDQTTWVISN